MGHSYCAECSRRLTSCPVCRAPHKPERHVLMEQFHDHVIFPCKEESCSALVLGSKILEHEENCFASWYSCPVTHFDYCTWIGPASGAVQHCLEVHRNTIFLGPTVSYTWDQIRPAFEGIQVDYLAFAYGHIFHCALKHEGSIVERLTWSVCDLGSDGGNPEFGFQLEIRMQDSDEFTQLAPCGRRTDCYRDNNASKVQFDARYSEVQYDLSGCLLQVFRVSDLEE